MAPIFTVPSSPGTSVKVAIVHALCGILLATVLSCSVSVNARRVPRRAHAESINTHGAIGSLRLRVDDLTPHDHARYLAQVKDIADPQPDPPAVTSSDSSEEPLPPIAPVTPSPRSAPVTHPAVPSRAPRSSTLVPKPPELSDSLDELTDIEESTPEDTSVQIPNKSAGVIAALAVFIAFCIALWCYCKCCTNTTPSHTPVHGGHRYNSHSMGHNTRGKVHNSAPVATVYGHKHDPRTQQAPKVKETDSVEDFFCLGVPTPDIQHQVAHNPSIRGSCVQNSQYEPEETRGGDSSDDSSDDSSSDSSDDSFDDVSSSQNERWERVPRPKIASNRQKSRPYRHSETKNNLASNSRSKLTYKNVSQHTERLKRKAAISGKVVSTLPVLPHACGRDRMHVAPHARGSSRMHAASVPYQYPYGSSRSSAASSRHPSQRMTSLPETVTSFHSQRSRVRAPSRLRKSDIIPGYVAPRLATEACDTFDITHTVPPLLTPPQPDASAEDKKEFVKQQLDSFGLDQPIYATIHLLGRSSPYRFEGGQAVVQMAVNRSTKEELAIKLFLSSTAFEAEKQLYLQSRKDTNQGLSQFLPRVHKIYSADDSESSERYIDKHGCRLPPFIVMERGESLEDWARRQQPDRGQAFNMMHQVASRLKDLHALGYVHRDLKPGNVMWLPRENRWTIIDFGCVARTGESAGQGFTWRYAAPEVIADIRRKRKFVVAKEAVDAWSLGVMAFELLTGKPALRVNPFAGKEKMMDQIEGVNGQKLPWEGFMPPETRNQLGVLKGLVLQLLNRDPAKRPSMKEFCVSCDRVLAGTSVQ